MVLIKWSNSDDENKDEDQNQPTSIRSVQSSWQPSQNNSAITGQSSNIFAQTPSQQDNYLMSEQKSAIDEEKRRKEAEAAAQAEIARQSVPQQTITYTQQEGQPAQPVDETSMETAKNDTGWNKYYDEELNKQKSGMNFFDRLLDAGQASKRAETLARVRYNSDILNQAYDTSGNTINQAAADQASNLAAYNQSQATQNSAESLARTRAMGATPDTQPKNFWDTVGNVINAEKNSSIYDAIMGVDDSQNFSINDAARFVGGLGQGIFTAPVIGAKELYEAGTGTGTDEQTGYQKELSGGERLGRGIAGALGVVTPFVGGSGKLLEGAFMSNAEKAAINAVKEGTATQAERLLAQNALRPTVAKGLVYPTLEQSAIGATQTGAEYFGQGNNIVDENGNIDPEKFAELAKQVGESAAMNIVGGATLSGAGMGLRRLRDRGDVLPENIPQRNKQLDVTPITESRTNIPELSMTPINRLGDSNITPIADRTNIVYRTPVQENIPIVNRNEIPLNQENIADATVPIQPRVMDIPEQVVTPDTTANIQKPITNLADGTVTPALEPTVSRDNIPTLSSEVKALQDAKVGATQAEESAINQELQNIQWKEPAYTRRIPKTVGGAESKYRLTGDTGINDIIFNADNNIKNGLPIELQDTEFDTIPAYMRKRSSDVIPSLERELSKQDDILSYLQSDNSRTTAFKDKQMIAKAYRISRELGDRVRNYISERNSKVSNDIEGNIKQNIIERNKISDELRQYTKARDVQQSIESKKQPNTMDYTDVDIPSYMRKQAKEYGIPQTELTPIKNLPNVKSNEVSTVKDIDNIPAIDTTNTTANQDLAGRVVSRLDEPKEYIRQVANMLDSSGTNIAENMGDTLSMFGGKGNQALKNRISDKYDNLRQKVTEYNVLQNENLTNLTGDGVSSIDSDISRQRSSIQNQIGLIQKDLEGDITRLAMQISSKERAKQIYNNLNRYRKSNILFGAPSIERNITQDLLGTIVDVFKNPNLMRSTILKMPESYASSIKNSLREWTIPPKVASDIPRYVVGNLYNSAMSLVGVEGLIKSRKAGYRDVIARNVLDKLGEPATSANIKKIAGVMGNEAETLANTAAGVANFMTSNTQFKRAADNYFKYLETGDPVARQNFLDNVERQSTITSQLTQNLKMGNSPVGHIAAAALDFISPFVRTATNAVDTAFTGTLSPKSMSPADYLLKDIRSGKHNFGSILKNKTIDAATLMGISGLVNAGIISFNNGDEIDKPQGISIKVGENQYIPIRATNIELPIALVYTATQIMNDVDNGNIGTDKIPEYINIIDGSLPYVESIAQSKESLESLLGTNNDGQGDNGYAAKAFGINAAKSFVPFSNNSLQPFIAGKQGQSLNTKSTYDPNMGTWFGNTMVKSYPMIDQEAYNRLKDSRDAAGRIRTVDNQGVLINKTINDTNTAKYNNTIDDLVAYGKESKLGSGVKDMFNTYDTGKNNNFKSIQDTITFLDSDGKPDNTKKLEPNAKLTNLSQQIRNGFFGDTSAELLTLDGKNLMSDVSMPNTSGTKNTNQPISMQSIVNSIAQTDLSEDQRNKMYAISQQDSDLWNQYKNKTITYNQYASARQATGQAYRDVLSSSENYQKLSNLMTKLDSSGFFADGGLGSTRSGQTYLWNALNSLLGYKGKTPAAAYPESSSKYSPYSRSGYSRRSGGSSGSGFNATNKPSDTGTTGIKWTPVKATQMATAQTSKYTPFNIKVKLGSQVKKNKTQDYSDRSF